MLMPDFDNVITNRLYEARTPFGKKAPERDQNQTKAKLSTRHFYFAENPTFLFCVDTELRPYFTKSRKPRL